MARTYDLPSLTALHCFEAAARKLSFKEAASELNVTPTAVSHQIRALETDLGQPLFRRQHRGVELTESGAYLFHAVQRSFEAISDVVRDMRGVTSGEDVVVFSSTAMSALWLTPKLSHFWRSHADIGVSQIVSDAPAPDGIADLTLTYGDLDPDDPSCRLMFQDQISAVGSRSFAADHGIKTAADLHRAPLIHVVGERQHWTGWIDWLGGLGCPAPTGQRIAVNNYMIALQMAKDGIGAVLGWDGLIGGMIDSGELGQLVPDRIASPQCFYIRTHRRASPKAIRLRDWLVAA
ncbi:MAG: LysR family transcriptional regulator [Paracoccaceae bacterium]